ncbi:GumC family protein [Filimonas lacunae]|uniref:GumC family protein n=1 Tax=Filimonas lacunae TaxID=477680 RepID=UPI0007D731B9|nr:polysaccharide biosynthesis tyrosine autokinase [Filimonas lacunae]BAV04279.1 tyrosine-protein kinase Wzc [Filimonas lacunae]
MQHEFVIEQVEPDQENEFFKKLGGQFLILWPWLIASIVVCVALSYLYLKYQTPEYRIRASILIQDDKNSTANVGILEEFGLLKGTSSVDNEAEIFKSYALMKDVVVNNQLFIKYYYSGQLKATELYLNRPITMRYVNPNSDSSINYGEYLVAFDAKDINKFTVTVLDKKYVGKFGEIVHLPTGDIIINTSDAFVKWRKEEPVTVFALPVNRSVAEYMSRLGVAIPNKQVSIISLSLKEIIPQKGEIILNSLINTYLQANVNDANQIADSTIRFIDDRLQLVFKELSGIEKDIEGFKKENRLTDITEQSRLLLENTSDYSKQLTEKEVQLAVIEALEEFLISSKNETRVVPSSLVMQDPVFISLIQRYNEVQLVRDKMLMSTTETHPSVQTINEQLLNLRGELLSSIASVKRGVQIGVNELRKRTGAIESQVSKVPGKERIWLDFSRQQAIKQELYLFLLKKREETAISKSSTLANARVIDAAKADDFPFKPNRKSFLLLGFVLGLAIPFAFYYIKELLNSKVSSSKDIKNYTSAPILAEIGHNGNDEEVVALAARSLISEQFRSLRTNVKFLMANEDEKVILITSSMGGEGKSFLSINLAATLALTDKKVILLELDLRKPRITDILKLRRIGISNYLVDSNANWKELLQFYGADNKFDILSSGPLPPNPAELLMLPKMSALVKTLKEHYDYVVIDSASVGLVTDAEVLAVLADVTLYVVRHAFTHKQQINWLNKLYLKKTLPKLNIIINDVQLKKSGYSYEGYGYAYGYGLYGEKNS